MMIPKIGYLQAYGNFWKYYADFSGRTTKEAFWKAYFIIQLINFALSIPIFPMMLKMMESAKSLVAETFINMGAGITPTTPSADLTGFDYGSFAYIMAIFLFAFVMIIPMIALYIRRLHDIDRHGAYFLLFCIPYAGIIIMLVMLTRPSAPYDVHPGQPSGPYPYEPRPQQAPYVQQQYGYPGPYGQQPAPVLLRRPRRFSPYAGGNDAAAAIILSIIVYVASMGYSFWASAHYTEQMMELIENATEDMSDWNYSDSFDSLPIPDLDPHEPYLPGDDYYGDEWSDLGGGELTEKELAATDQVKTGTIDGFPAFSIEEVLLSRVGDDGLRWDYYEESFETDVLFSVSAAGLDPETYDLVYASFSMMSDGRIVVTNIMIGDRDEYGQRAREVYDDWYRNMLTYGGAAKSA
jgi:uncharacterized membrane protein YhaH (DUF805 family)